MSEPERSSPSARWRVGELYGGEDFVLYRGMAQIAHVFHVSDAALIVQAMNAHEAMKEALTDAIDALVYLSEYTDEDASGPVTPRDESIEELVLRLQAALALAEEQG